MGEDAISTYLDLKKYNEELVDWGMAFEQKLNVHVKDSIREVLATIGEVRTTEDPKAIIEQAVKRLNAKEGLSPKDIEKEVEKIADGRPDILAVLKTVLRGHALSTDMVQELNNIVASQIVEAYVIGRIEGAYEDARLFSQTLQKLIKNGSIADPHGDLEKYIKIVMQKQEENFHEQMKNRHLSVYSKPRSEDESEK